MGVGGWGVKIAAVSKKILIRKKDIKIELGFGWLIGESRFFSTSLNARVKTLLTSVFGDEMTLGALNVSALSHRTYFART